MSTRRDRVPRSLRPLVGGAVLALSVRLLDAVWHRVTGRPTPIEARAVEADVHAGEPSVVRDRLFYALLIGSALRIARRSGLPRDAGEDGREGTDRRP